LISGPSLAAEIGRAYDAVPYDAGAAPALGLPSVRGAAAALGLDPQPGPALDVLDIGCGAGAQLFLAAQQSTGRMLGLDASAEACGRARARGAALGGRWSILHGDAASVDAAALGQFDVIYLVGTVYVMPPPARMAALELVGRCLRPGGVAVVTGYTGLQGIARAGLAAILRAGNTPTLPPDGQVALARTNLRAVAGAIPDQGAAPPLARATLASMETSPDVVLFHEALGPVFDSLNVAALEAALAPHGVRFLNSSPPLALAPAAASAVLARSADALEFATGGGYRTLLFGRASGAGPGIRHPGLTWATALRRREPGAGGGFTDGAGTASIHGHSPASLAQLEALCAGPGTWRHLRDTAAALLLRNGGTLPDPATFDASLDEILMLLWRQSLAQPILDRPFAPGSAV
jgi:SAM-dependent methyltransferase